MQVDVRLADGSLLAAVFDGPAPRAGAFAEAVERALTAAPLAGSSPAEIRVTTDRGPRPIRRLAAGTREETATLVARLLDLEARAHGFSHAPPPPPSRRDPYLLPAPSPPSAAAYRLCGTGHAGCQSWEECSGGLCRDVCGRPCGPPSLTAPRCARELLCQDEVCFHASCAQREVGDACGGPLSCVRGLLCVEGRCRQAEP